MTSQLAIEGVFARDSAGENGAPRGALVGASMRFDVGVTAVLGAPEDGSLALLDVLSGETKPRRGSVRVGGVDPFDQPGIRRRTGVLAASPALPPARTVADAVSLGRSGLSSPNPIPSDSVLASLGLGHWGPRRLGSLSVGELRAVELGLALSTPDPAMILLHEPFSGVEGIGEELLAQSLALVASVAPVIIVTSSPADARRSDRIVSLYRGVLSPRPGVPGITGGVASHLAVWVRRGARQLAAELSSSSAVSGLFLELDDPRATEAGPAPPGDVLMPPSHGEAAGVLRVTGRGGGAVSRAIAEAVTRVDCEVVSMSEVASPLGEVRMALDWEARAAVLAAHVTQSAEARARDTLAAMGRPITSTVPFGAPVPPAPPPVLSSYPQTPEGPPGPDPGATS